MSTVSLVPVSSYRSYQYDGLLAEFQRLHWAGLLTPIYMEAARTKWGCTPDEAQLAVYETVEMP